MIVDVTTKAVCQIDIDSYEAFRILCKTLDMDIVLDEDRDFFVVRDSYGDAAVYYTRDGHDECADDRGDLFIALRNVAANLFPNTYFRNAPYIYKGE